MGHTEKLGLEKRVELTFGPDFRWIEVAAAGAEPRSRSAPRVPG